MTVERDVLHSGVRQYLHRMIICLGDELLGYVPLAISLLLKDCKVLNCNLWYQLVVICWLCSGSWHPGVHSSYKSADLQVQRKTSSCVERDLHACVCQHHCLSQPTLRPWWPWSEFLQQIRFLDSLKQPLLEAQALHMSLFHSLNTICH